MKRRFFPRAFLLALGAALFPLFHGSAHACSVCISGITDERLTDAFNWSIFFMMAMPYTILFSVIGFFFLSYRRAARKARGETEKAPLLPLAWIHKESGR